MLSPHEPVKAAIAFYIGLHILRLHLNDLQSMHQNLCLLHFLKICHVPIYWNEALDIICTVINMV